MSRHGKLSWKDDPTIDVDRLFPASSSFWRWIALSLREWHQIASDGWDTFPCVYCGCPAQELDHVLPVRLGGGKSLENRVPACRPCNQAKSGLHPGDWLLRKPS